MSRTPADRAPSPPRIPAPAPPVRHADEPGDLVRAKVRPPGPPEPSIERPRVRAALARQVAEYPIVVVVGAAGAGKTTAVADFARRSPAVAWLTLDVRDRPPRRFLQYLAHSLAEFADGVEAFTADCLRGGLEVADCAALIGERVRPGTLVVLDDVHEIDSSEATQRALGAFVQALAEDVRVILASRVFPSRALARAGIAGHVGVLGDRDLAFDRDETGATLGALGSDADPEAVMRVTNGWAAGVAFEVLRIPDASAGAPRREMLFAYLSQEVTGALDPDLRQMAIASGVLTAVTPQLLEALLEIPDGAAALAALHRLPLPHQLDGDVLRWHPLCREFLWAELDGLAPGARRALFTRAAQALQADGQHEDAVAMLLTAGETERAAAAAAEALGGLLRRGDAETALDWIRRLGPDAAAADPRIRMAQIQALHMARRQAEVTTLIGEIIASGELAGHAAEHPEVTAAAAWALRDSGDWRTVLELLPPPPGPPQVEALRFILATGCGDEPVEPPSLIPGEAGSAIAISVLVALWYRGRFEDMERLVERTDERGPVTSSWYQMVEILLLTKRGRADEARRALDSVDEVFRATSAPEYWAWHEADILAELGDTDAAVERIRDARRLAAERSEWLSRGAFAAYEGRLLVLGRRFSEALAVLREVHEWSDRHGIAACREWADAWMGGALLALGRDDEALGVLEEVVRRMSAADRLKEFQAAAVFLAEARWRAGDRDGHQAAARLAAEAAGRMGTHHPSLVALRALPEVRGPGIAALQDCGPSDRTEGAALVRLRTFGAGAIEVDGRPVATGRLGRSLEVAAEIARAGSRGVERSRLMAHHLPESRSPENSLRQLLHRLRRRLPAGVVLESSGSRLRFAPPGAVVADDDLAEQMILRARARGLAAEERMRLLRSALALTGDARYLSRHDGEAVRERRDDMDRLVAEARVGLTEALLATGDAAAARHEAARLVEEDPYAEAGWGLLIRSTAESDGPAAALSTFSDHSRVMRGAGLEVSPQMRMLVRDCVGSANGVT